MGGRLGYSRIRVEDGRRTEFPGTTKCRGRGVMLASLHSLCHVANRPASSLGLGAPEILPLAQAWERAPSFGFALGGCSVLEIHSSSSQECGFKGLGDTRHDEIS